MYLGKFKTQVLAKEYVRELLHKTPYGITINPEFRNIIEYHPNKEEKIGSGIANIIIDIDLHDNKLICIERTDGTIATIGWNACIKRPSIEQQSKYNLNQALRSAIQPQIDNFRSNNVPVCALCSTRGYCEVDHIYMFKDLIKDFTTTSNPILVKDYTQWTLFDNDYKNEWIEHHAKYATLRMLCKKCHDNRKLI